jgi:hypothetical protein
MRSGPNDDPNIPDALFLIHRSDDGDDSYTDTFVSIASPTNLTSINVGSPNTGQDYYLTNSWTLDFTNPDTMADSVIALKSRVDLLAEALEMMRDTDTLPETHVAEYES